MPHLVKGKGALEKRGTGVHVALSGRWRRHKQAVWAWCRRPGTVGRVR
jgi:hypothetical protein